MLDINSVQFHFTMMIFCFCLFIFFKDCKINSTLNVISTCINGYFFMEHFSKLMVK